MEAMFDLDMALSMLTREENYIRTKLSEKKAFNHNQLSEMPVVTGADAGECAVCMEVFESDVGGKQVPCGHVFHSVCIFKWLSDHNSCPLCRSTVFSTGDAHAENHQH
ncbi:OLC1v1037544C1 [Oldenlandia corymbosa var. corymbosa]|uniref:OLC1v1037544C1 n=1 Tax=Oldenlandia corymbosa var. corymbosa TaxID=529605 RepID=A0AAV1CXQ8_OLDCO|nr:OLC1v1037544C1 [Oldenlandia corymbosa var. corymbosa]